MSSKRKRCFSKVCKCVAVIEFVKEISASKARPIPESPCVKAPIPAAKDPGICILIIYILL
eukprot:1249175-Karenia_brevis.AAC.1